MVYMLLMPALTGALIGWITNYVAIKLLFRPHVPIDVFGYRIQGLIPKRRKEIARSMARAIEKELLSSEDLAASLNGIDWKSEVEKSVEEVVEHRFGARSINRLPVIGLVSENLRYHLKYILTREILRQVDKKKVALLSKVRDNIDIKELLVSRIDRLDLMKFEGLLTEFIARELKHLEWLGGIMGFFIGLAQAGFSIYFG